ncbi:MAG: C1 family peptidase [Candidatus Marinimicrobia bacterium]|nr:C1 family peptidase [Candidatus Neomarinimicrobiota bacterium]
MKKTTCKAVIFLLTIIFQILPGFAKSDGSITPEMIKKYERQLDLKGTDKALMNAVTNTEMKQLTLNREIYNNHNDVFSFKIKTEGITDQKSSGRCWMFAGFNIMRPGVIKKYNLSSFEFSETFLFFWDKLEKSNLFLEIMIDNAAKDLTDREMQKLFETPVADGGWWNYFVALIEKYGAVPKEVYPETVNSEKSAGFNYVINNLMRHDAIELRRMVQKKNKKSAIKKRKEEMLADVFRLLVYHFGLPPQNFTWKYADKDNKVVEKEYTPKEFYEEVVGIDLKEYVTIMDHAMHPYNTHYEINYCRNFVDMPNMDFINLDIAELKKLTLATLLDSTPVWFAADVGHYMEKERGIMAVDLYDYQTLFQIDTRISKKDRLLTRASTPNHGMVFTGVDLKDGKPVKWLVENSWGSKIGNGGRWTMYDNWFDEYVFTIIIHKSRLSEDVLKLLKTKPSTLPPWDPMMTVLP